LESAGKIYGRRGLFAAKRRNIKAVSRYACHRSPKFCALIELAES